MTAAVAFDAVGGHKSAMHYGPDTVAGLHTVTKPTTAWEVIFYLGMTFGEDIAVPSASSDILEFIRAMKGLRVFTPQLFSVRLPASWTPGSAALAVMRTETELKGIADRHGAFLPACDSRYRPFWVAVFRDLFSRSRTLEGFDVAFDLPTWGIGLVDETSGMCEPAVLDIKVGYYRLSPFAPLEKVKRTQRKEGGSLTPLVGLRICGVRRFVETDGKKRSRESHGKELGFVFRTEEEVATTLRAFASTVAPLATTTTVTGERVVTLSKRPAGPVRDLATARTRLAAMHAWLTALLAFFDDSPEGTQLLKSTALVSTSLLLMYDAADSSGSVKVRLIDFARCSPRRLNFDEKKIGFLDGLRNFAGYLSPQ